MLIFKSAFCRHAVFSTFKTTFLQQRAFSFLKIAFWQIWLSTATNTSRFQKRKTGTQIQPARTRKEGRRRCSSKRTPRHVSAAPCGTRSAAGRLWWAGRFFISWRVNEFQSLECEVWPVCTYQDQVFVIVYISDIISIYIHNNTCS